ncbi:hypothetical protein Q1695_011608 [Nippostrongylus brasiliensis]|nr:hypothetical protein Q1695_011608 [Nippostrongylus brasiliensis]
MAFRQDSKETDLSVRHSHLAPPTVPPDSPRPQKDSKSDLIGSSMTVTMKVPDTKKENNVLRLDSIQVEERRK